MLFLEQQNENVPLASNTQASQVWHYPAAPEDDDVVRNRIQRKMRELQAAEKSHRPPSCGGIAPYKMR